MRMTVSIPAAIALAAFIHAPGKADCVDVTTTASSNSESGIAKDGTHAPLEGAASSQVQTHSETGTTTTSADALAQQPQKDGEGVPLGESSSLATSAQDAAAQQEGEKTAAAAASDDKC
ncbi:MAG TPA: hypothetical protein VGO22_16015 [Pseudorhizobium sp.]|nr:hypothetical protein [Pseudorhizobium sp.]